MTRLIFVDDETRVLQAMRRSLRSQRDCWDMTFCQGAAEAMKAMQEHTYDALITDTRLAGISGYDLMKWAVKNSPATTRIVLTGHGEMDHVLKTIPIAHEYLTKPFPAPQLVDVLRRILDLRSHLSYVGVREAIGGADTIPTLPSVYSNLRRALANQNSTMKEVADVVRGDMAICAKLLGIVNSGYFSRGRTVTELDGAVRQLGLDLLHDLVLNVDVFQAFAPKLHIPGFSITKLQRRSVATSLLAPRLLPERHDGRLAAMAAQLHDIGLLFMAARMPERLALTMRESIPGQSLHLIERRIAPGFTHAEVGAYILGLWGLPHRVVEAVGYHHEPDLAQSPEFDVVSAVHVASVLVDQCYSGRSCRSTLDVAHLQRVGCAHKVPEWREIAIRVCQKDMQGAA